MKEEDIPSAFYSFETKTPFEHCIECEKYLLDEQTEYLIEKAVRNYPGYRATDTVFDYAICIDCAENLRKDISSESWSRMLQYFQEHIDVQERMEMSHRDPIVNLQNCLIKKTAIESCAEYQMFAHCKGTKLNMENPPYAISGEVIEEILPLLSTQTVDEMNGFFNKHFSPDPSFFEPTPKLLLV